MTRRTLLSTVPLAAAAASAKPTRKEWTPKLGVLGPYTPANIEFLHSHGFRNLIMNGGLVASDGKPVADSVIEEVKTTLRANNVAVSAFQLTVNHIHPDPAKRAAIHRSFVMGIETAGRLGVPYIGTASGKDAAKSFPQQVDEIVRVYQETYFRACEANHVRILWEPWPDGPNIATSPVGYHALFKAFGDSPYVGLQYDPSHLVRQFMDPIQTARDFVDKIYDVHLKDTEILWPVVRAGGITPVDGASWWRYRIPGSGSIDWREFFNVLEDVGYAGAMSIEQEDDLYGADNNPGPDFSDEFKVGLVMAKRYLDQYVP